MAHREFVDDDGTRWQMWEVHPTLAERRHARNPAPPGGLGERRKRRSVFASGLGRPHAGWLAIQSSTERRRIVPVPEGWETRTDEELREMLRSSVSTGKRRRLIE